MEIRAKQLELDLDRAGSGGSIFIYIQFFDVPREPTYRLAWDSVRAHQSKLHEDHPAINRIPAPLIR
jgi:hypothetical protein